VSRPALLDVNVIVALFDADHLHHEAAHDWFADNRAGGWATCPLTENGFVRILSNPAYGAAVERTVTLLDGLRRFCASGQHHFWPASLSLRDERVFNLAFVRGPRQLTDVYLLGLAKKMGGRLATFDRSIPLKAVPGCKPDTIDVIGTA
jgi:uncharacterized protein